MPSSSDSLTLYVDGGSRGNPGPAGGGFVLLKNGKILHKGSEFFGEKTNNQAEYMALRLALNTIYLKFSGKETEVDCFMDSKLAVEQMNGNWKVKNANIKSLFQEARKIADQFKAFTITHIPREENGLADMLANQAMDRG